VFSVHKGELREKRDKVLLPLKVSMSEEDIRSAHVIWQCLTEV